MELPEKYCSLEYFLGDFKNPLPHSHAMGVQSTTAEIMMKNLLLGLVAALTAIAWLIGLACLISPASPTADVKGVVTVPTPSATSGTSITRSIEEEDKSLEVKLPWEVIPSIEQATDLIKILKWVSEKDASLQVQISEGGCYGIRWGLPEVAKNERHQAFAGKVVVHFQVLCRNGSGGLWGVHNLSRAEQYNEKKLKYEEILKEEAEKARREQESLSGFRALLPSSDEK